MIERDAVPADADALAEIGAATFTATFGHLYTPDDLGLFLENHRPEAWAEDLADPQLAVRVAEADGALIGYAKVGPAVLPFTPEQGAWELRQLYVLPPWQGSGLAARMMDWAIATATSRGASEIYLSVFIDNERARRFYARYGFEAVGRWAFMVGTHADEDIIMRRRL